MFGLFLLNINYWCANQTIMQRSLAAKSLRHAQIGLMAGGAMKYVMAVLIVVPGIALYGILGENGLAEPDMAFPYLVKTYLPTGVKGIILCALFASLMSTVDSTFNSLATLWSIDIYKGYLNKDATDAQVVQTGKRTILVTLLTGVTMGLVLLYVKFENPEAAFTHTLNELRYYINCGIVVLICTAAFMITPNKRATLIGFFSTIPLQLLFIQLFPEMNYFVRAMWVILIAMSIAMLGSFTNGSRRRSESREYASTLDSPFDDQPSPKVGFRSGKDLIQYDSPEILRLGGVLLASLILLHIVFN